jgi:hypothetical protein
MHAACMHARGATPAALSTRCCPTALALTHAALSPRSQCCMLLVAPGRPPLQADQVESII